MTNPFDPNLDSPGAKIFPNPSSDPTPKLPPLPEGEPTAVVVHIAKEKFDERASESKIAPASDQVKWSDGRTLTPTEYHAQMTEVARAAEELAATGRIADEIKPDTAVLINGHENNSFENIDGRRYSEMGIRDFAAGGRSITVSVGSTTKQLLPSAQLRSSNYKTTPLTREALEGTVYSQFQDIVEKDPTHVTEPGLLEHAAFHNPHSVTNELLSAVSQTAMALPSNRFLMDYAAANNGIMAQASSQGLAMPTHIKFDPAHVLLTQKLVLTPPPAGNMGVEEGMNLPTWTITQTIKIPNRELNKAENTFGSESCNLQFTYDLHLEKSGPSLSEQAASPEAATPRVRKRDTLKQKGKETLGQIGRRASNLFEKTLSFSRASRSGISERDSASSISSIGPPQLRDSTSSFLREDLGYQFPQTPSSTMSPSNRSAGSESLASPRFPISEEEIPELEEPGPPPAQLSAPPPLPPKRPRKAPPLTETGK